MKDEGPPGSCIGVEPFHPSSFIFILPKMALSRGLAPRTSAFAERRAETNYTLRANCIEPPLASVIGLAPIRPGLKGRLLELLCIHGRKAGRVGR